MRAAPVSKIFLLAVAAAFRSGPAPSHRLTPRVRRVSGLGADGDRGRSVVFVRDATTRVAVSSSAAVATRALITHSAVGPVASSSFVGLAAGASLPTPLATAAFCGSFCGMTSRAVAPGAADVAALGAAAAALLAGLDATRSRLLRGYGGRLGVVAALACAASICATPSLRASGALFQPELAARAAAPDALRTAVAASVLGAAATRAWARGLPELLLRARGDGGGGGSAAIARATNPVSSASLIGLAVSLALWACAPVGTAGDERNAIAACAFVGAFVAMSPREKLGSTRATLLAAGVAGLAQAGLAAVAVGAGGKLGAASAIGVFVARYLRLAAGVVLISRART